MFQWRLSPRSWIPLALVRRLFSFALFFAALSVTGIVRADETPADERTFDELAREGDLARLAGRNSDAVRAYTRALKLRNDARIEGRLGLVALAGGAPAQAAPHLLRAIVDGSAIPPAELQQIEIAFNRARPLVSRIGVKISHVGAQVTIDGKLESIGTSATDFYVFRSPGRHEFRATLEGFEDAVVSIDTEKGSTVDVSLVLVPLHETPPEPVPVVTCEPCEQKADSAPLEGPKPSTRPQNHAVSNERKIPSWSFGLGPTAVFGGVAPFPALGVVVSVDKHLGSFYSLRIDFRYAMSPREIEGYAIRGSTIGVIPSICVNKSIFSGCLMSQLGAVRHSGNLPSPFSIWRSTVGFGASASVNIVNTTRFALKPSVDVAILTDSLPIVYGNSSTWKQTLWTGYPFLLGVSIAGVWHSSTL